MLFSDKGSASDGAGLGINKYPSPEEKKLSFHSRRKLLIFPMKKSGRAGETWTEPKGLSSLVFFNVTLVFPVR